MSQRRSTCIIVIACLGLCQANAQHVLNSHTYSENFNSLASQPGNGNHDWVQNSTLLNWEVYRKQNDGTPWVAATTYGANSGSGLTYGLYSFGSDSLDRSLGARPHSNVDSGSFRYGTGFLNNLGEAIVSATINFRAEVWWKGASKSLQTLRFQYSTTAEGINSEIGWLDCPDLNFSWSHDGSESTTTNHIDGNQVGANLTATLDGLALQQGQKLWIRWVDIDDQTVDHGMGIDDLSITFHTASVTPVPEPATMVLAGLAAVGAVRRKLRQRN